MDQLKHPILLSVALILLVYVIGLIVYHYIEGWSFIDCLYFQTATFTTVGYGDITPKTDAGKIFTIFISWIGISTAFYVLYSISTYRQHILDRKVDSVLSRISGAITPKKVPRYKQLG